MFLALPRDDLDTGDLCAASKVDHPGGPVNVEVVKHCAAMHADGDVPVDGSRRLTTYPLTTHVPLVLTLIVHPRTLLKRYVLH